MAGLDLEHLTAGAAERIGGPARAEVMALLAGVLALAFADQGVVAAAADQLKKAFALGNTEFGLLLAVVAFAAAVGTLPVGALVDRYRRDRILVLAILAWSAASALSAFATSYVFLLSTRIVLGLVTAAAWPCVASLTGDFFPARERGNAYGFIVAGEFVGVGAGYMISGWLSGFLGWRWAFGAMAVLSLALGVVVWRFLPEPARGGQGWLEQGETDPRASEHPKANRAPAQAGDDDAGGDAAFVRQMARKAHIEPRADLVLREDPTRRGLVWAIGYCLRIPTYRLLVIASALAYYFLTGATAFGMVFFTGHYRLTHTAATSMVLVLGAGALAGVIGGGRVSTWLLNRGRLAARVTVPGIALAASVPVFGVAIWVRSAWIGVPLMAVGAALLSAAVAPLDAARLDIVHPRLWGRAEAGRMALRNLGEATAPLAFGAMSTAIGGADGLMWTFLIMLAPMLAASLFTIPGRLAYPTDVATAAASVDALRTSRRATHGGE